MSYRYLYLVPPADNSIYELFKQNGAIHVLEKDYWYIPCGVDVRPLKKYINPRIKIAGIKDFSEDSLKRLTDFKAIENQSLFYLEADVYKRDGDIYKIINNNNTQVVFTLKIDKSLWTDFSGKIIHKKIALVGSVSINFEHLSFQINPIWFKVIGDSLSRTTTQDWREKTTQFTKTKKLKPYELNITDEVRIGLITSKFSKGYSDFCNKLFDNRNANFTEDNIFFEHVNLKPSSDNNKNISDEIIYAMGKLTIAGCDCICIIRGGGDEEDLLTFSNPNLKKMIYLSEIPVITGIGHSEDKVLADDAADYAADTPSAAADFINFAYNSTKKRLQKADDEKYIEELLSQNIELKTKIQELRDKNYELYLVAQNSEKAVKELKEEIEQLRNRGFFKRLFNS